MQKITEIQWFNQKIILIDEFCNLNGWEPFRFRVSPTGGIGGRGKSPHHPKIHSSTLPNFYSLPTKSQFSPLINCSRDSLIPDKLLYLMTNNYGFQNNFFNLVLRAFSWIWLEALDMIKQKHLEFMIKINIYITYLISFSCYRAESYNQLWTCTWHTKYLILIKYLLFEITKNMKSLQRQ